MRFQSQVSKSLLSTKAFQEGCVDQVVGLLLEHMAIVSTHIAFPEYAIPTVVQLRKFLSTCKNGKIKAQLKQILDKVRHPDRVFCACCCLDNWVIMRVKRHQDWVFGACCCLKEGVIMNGVHLTPRRHPGRWPDWSCVHCLIRHA